MKRTITRIELGKGNFGVNAYLIRTEVGFVLVDTGMRKHRETLEARLAEEGCTPGTLKLVLITHGDMDHIGSAAHLRETFSAPIAMHEGDIGMTRDGDMFSGRSGGSWAVRTFLKMLLRLPQADRFTPDIPLSEASDLSAYGLDGVKVLRLVGHSAGSVALLFDDGSLICGDLLENRSTPRLGSIMDDIPAAEGSVERLQEFHPRTVYPGHGTPFDFAELPIQTVGSRDGR